MNNKKEKKMTFFDFCSGIGGGRLGLEKLGFKCLGFSEIDKMAIKTYKTFFDTSSEMELGDLTKINPNELDNFDLLISGFPCQSFSIVGKREGLKNQEKGQIIFNLANILKIKQPSFFILENVKGLINHNKGKTFKTILNILENCKYNVFYSVLNTLDFGLAHSRERIYFIGIKKEKKEIFNFPKTKNNVTLNNFLSPKKDNLIKNYETFIKYLNNKYNKNKFNLNEILRCDYLILDTRQSDLRVYENKIPTLRRDRQGIFYTYKNELYNFSAIEALRLQGFGVIDNLENIILDLKQSDILKQCGNAMSVNVITEIGKNIKEIL